MKGVKELTHRRRMRAGFKAYDHGEPLRKIDTRPMAFVFGLIVLMMLLVQTVPKHALVIKLPGKGEVSNSSPERLPPISIAVLGSGEVELNGKLFDRAKIGEALARLPQSSLSAPLKFSVERDVSYDEALQILGFAVASGVTGDEVCFEDSRQHKVFESSYWSYGLAGSLNIAYSIPHGAYIGANYEDWEKFEKRRQEIRDHPDSRTFDPCKGSLSYLKSDQTVP